MSDRPRVILISSYFALLEQGMGPQFRTERMESRSRVRDGVMALADIVADLLVDSSDAAGDAIEQIAALQADAIVIAPTMATPPEWLVSAVRNRPDLPVIILAVRELDSVPDDYDTEKGTSHSLLVGVTMLGNAFLREPRSMALVLGTAGDDTWLEQLRGEILGAAGAARIRRSRLLVGGAPIEGYSDVEVTSEDLARLGVEVVSIDDEILAARMDQVTDQEHDTMTRWVSDTGEVHVDGEVLARSVTLACALRDLVDAHGVDGGTVNCHGPVFRQSDRVGITACLAVTHLTTTSRMFSCTGDIPIALMLILGRDLAGAALYCELYAVDRPGNWILVANGGEGDLSFAVAGTTRFLYEDHYRGRKGPGVATAFDVAGGPATLTSLTPLGTSAGGWRMIVMEGEILGSRHRRMEGPNAMFGPRDLDALSAFSSWTTAGAPHHAALIPGHWADVLRGVARHLGIECVAIEPDTR